MTEESVREVAARCLNDPDFANEILAGDAYPSVREAIAADLFGAVAEGDDVEAFGATAAPYKEYTKGNYQEMTGRPDFSDWMSMPRVNLNTLAGL